MSNENCIKYKKVLRMKPEDIKRVVIVGGVAGGASTAARLRRLNEHVEIIMLERGPYVSFANCGLPYYVGKVIKDREALILMDPDKFYDRFNFDVRVRNEAIKINRDIKEIIVKDLEKNEEYSLKYDVLVLSPGAEPLRPPIPGLDTVPYFTVRNIPDVDRIAKFIEIEKVKSAVVIGGGYIGIEMAENLKELDIEVNLIEMLDQVLIPFDKEMAQIVHQELGWNEIKLHLNARASGFSKPGKKTVIDLQKGDKIEKLETDLIILAVGVKPESKLAKDADLELTERGYIVVNPHMQTSDPDIYAVGDVIQVHNIISDEYTNLALAGIGNRQGRVTADNISGTESACEGVLGTAVLKIFGMTAAITGLNERQLKQMDINYEKIYAHPNNHAGYYPGAASLSMKLLFEKPSGKILGVQVIGGDGADKRVDVIATAMKFKGTVFDLERLELAYAPPYGSAKDPVNMLGFIASNVLRGTMEIWHWHDLEKIKEENGLILDVRTKEEFELEHFEGAVNISDLELRKHLDEIPKDRPIYIHCQVGFRGYLVYRTLIQLGYPKVANLTGGYKTYSYAVMKPEDFSALPIDPRVKILEQSIGRPGDDISGQKELKVIDACGLSCPGPLNSMIAGIQDLPNDHYLQIKATDPSFASSVKAYAELNEGVELLSIKKQGSELVVTIHKSKDESVPTLETPIKTEEPKNVPIRPVGLPIVSEISAKDLHNEIESDLPPAIIIDVREKNEWNHGHIEQAILIPLGQIGSKMKDLKKYKNKEIITVCHSGARSFMAGRLLERAGFEYIRSLQGGMISWVRSKYNFIKP
jgi:NADPH-dependent 2,4-dienoyl-CoA reductase/sulfur reductase-like enzyme/rhodanese-related sulfurtransferase/TusA-related sulfurtransferase